MIRSKYCSCVDQYVTDLVKSKAYLPHVTIFVLGMVTFGNSFNGKFVFDDNEAIINNQDVSKHDSSIYGIFFHDFWGSNMLSPLSHKSYRPLVVLSFRFNRWLCNGLHPSCFHATNIFLYAFVCVLFLAAFSSLFNKIESGESSCFKTNSQAFLSSLMFTVHPLHAENASAIVGRADLMCSLFYVVAFLSYIRFVDSSVYRGCSGGRVLHLIIFVLCSLCSLLSKEQGITVLGLCMMYEVAIESELLACSKNLTELWKASRPMVVRIVSLMTISAILVALRWKIMAFQAPTFQVHDNPQSFIASTFYRVLNYNYLYCLNAWLLINPWWLCFDWSMGCVPLIESLFDWRVLAVIALHSVVFVLLIAGFVSEGSTDRKVIVISMSWIVIPFLPSSNCFFRVGFVIAERNLLIPSAGLCMLVAAGINKLQARYKKTVIFAFLLLTCYFVRSVQRSSHWLDEETLFATGIQVCPQNAKVHYNVAKLAADKGNVDVALMRYHLAIELNPNYDQALNNLGNLYKEQGNLTKAETCLTKAVSIKPDFAAAWMNLGIVQTSLKKFTEAESSYRTALTHKTKYPDCHYNLVYGAQTIQKCSVCMEKCYTAKSSPC